MQGFSLLPGLPQCPCCVWTDGNVYACFIEYMKALDLWWRLQWALLILSADAAIIVSVVYWTLLFDGWVGPLNFQVSLLLTWYLC